MLVLAGCNPDTFDAETQPESDIASQNAALAWPSGNVDSISRHTVDGWACISDYKKPVWVHFYIDGVYRQSTVANSIRRPDAAHLCGGRDGHGFSWALPKLADGNHTVAAYVSTNHHPSTVARLPGASSVRFPYAWDPAAPGRPYGYVESMNATQITGWACDPSVPATPIGLHAYIQYDGVGPLHFLAATTTTFDRPDTTGPCGGGVKHGFVMPLPVVRGGHHNVLVYALDTAPAAQHNHLDEAQSIPNLVPFPYEPSDSADPNLTYAPRCWRGWAGFWDPITHPSRPGEVWEYRFTAPDYGTSSCPPGSEWFLSGDGYPFWGVPIPAPEVGYFGRQTRLRYDNTYIWDSSLFGSPGMVLKVDTRRNSNPMVEPCHFHFQAIQQNSGGHRPLTPDLRFEFNVTVSDADFVFSDNVDPGGCVSRPSEWGFEGFRHVLAALTFSTMPSGPGYFIELVPYWDTHQPNYGGNLPAHQGWGGYGSTDGKVTFEGYNSAGADGILLRAATTDPRIAPFISQPARMAHGETRAYYVDLRGLFQAAFPRSLFPDADPDRIWLGGYYVGTEHFNANAIALHVHRMSIVSRD